MNFTYYAPNFKYYFLAGTLIRPTLSLKFLRQYTAHIAIHYITKSKGEHIINWPFANPLIQILMYVVRHCLPLGEASFYYSFPSNTISMSILFIKSHNRVSFGCTEHIIPLTNTKDSLQELFFDRSVSMAATCYSGWNWTICSEITRLFWAIIHAKFCEDILSNAKVFYTKTIFRSVTLKDSYML